MKKFLLFLTLLVSAIGAQATNYKLVTSASDLKDGAKYIIVAQNGSDSKWYTLGTAGKNNFGQVAISGPVNNVISINSGSITVITLVNSNDDAYPYKLKDAGSSKYLYAAGGTSNNYLRAAETPPAPATATASISIATEGSAATIKFNNVDANKKEVRNWLRYNSSSNLFSCYTSGQADVYLYKEVTSGEDTKIATSISFEKASYTINLGDTFTSPTPKLTGIPEGATLSWESSNPDVATVDAGNVTLGKTAGDTKITATYAGDDTHAAASASYTLTVKKAQIAYLVTDASTLKPGDVIVIAAYGTKDEDDGTVTTWNTAISTSNANADYRGETNVNFNGDHSEITSIPNDALLIELEQTQYNGTDYWLFKTLNYTGVNGYLGNTAISSNNMKVVTNGNTNPLCYATIESNDDNTVKVLFNHGLEPSNSNKNGASYNKNYLQYNQTYTRFACYGAAQSNGQVYIYKVVDKPATVNTQVSEINFVEKVNASDNNIVKITANFLTSPSYKKVAIYMEDVLVGFFDVTDEEVKGTFDHVPYMPTAKFTMRPVLKTDTYGNPTQLGPSEALSFTWPDINTYGAETLDKKLVWIGSDADPLTAPATLGAVTYFGIDVKVANLNYYVDVVAKNQDTKEVYKGEFAWCEGGFSYAVNPYITGVPVDTENKSLKLGDYTGGFPIIEFSITPIYKFDVAEKYRSLVPAPTTPRPARVASSTITDGVQTVVCDAKPAKSEFSAASDVSGVEGVTVDANATVEFFNLQGIRVDGDLAPGIYIRRQGQAVSKVRIN